MDEVHYLADRSRGAVWEEVIIHLPESVALVSLSATVSNAEEFGEWLQTVRGDTTTIVEERRPVPLYQHVMVGKRLLDLFATSDVDAAAGFVKEGAPVNDELVRIARDDWASSRMRDRRTPQGRRGRRQARRPDDAGRQRPAGLDPEPGRRRRPARPRRPAAGDRVHLQPGRAATPPSQQCLQRQPPADRRRRSATRSARFVEEALPAPAGRRPRTCSATTTSSRR